jgi:adenosine/AMP kinase
MKKTAFFILTIVFTLVLNDCYAQTSGKVKRIKTGGDYTHKSTDVVFPKTVSKYLRTDIMTYDKKATTLDVVYQSHTGFNKTSVSIKIYPAGDGYDVRLRNEYLKSMQEIASTNNSEKISASQYDVFYTKDEYFINGYTAEIKNNDKHQQLHLSVYECGQWFLRLQLESDILKAEELSDLEQIFLDTINPVKIVINHNLNLNAVINILDAARIDSLLVGCAISYANAKADWAANKVDSLERICGFPDLYLDMHTDALNAFVKFSDNNKFSEVNIYTQNYIAELKSLINAGFLSEFILDQYQYVMIIPEDKDLDINGYTKWRLTNPITINLTNPLVNIVYPAH